MCRAFATIVVHMILPMRATRAVTQQDVYVSAHEKIDIDTLAREQDAMSVRVWHQTGLAYNWDPSNEVSEKSWLSKLVQIRPWCEICS